MTDLSDDIQTNAVKPAAAQDDEGRMQQHPLPDQIAADQYLSRVAAASRSGPPLRMFKIRPPGAV